MSLPHSAMDGAAAVHKAASAAAAPAAAAEAGSAPVAADSEAAARDVPVPVPAASSSSSSPSLLSVPAAVAAGGVSRSPFATRLSASPLLAAAGAAGMQSLLLGGLALSPLPSPLLRSASPYPLPGSPSPSPSSPSAGSSAAASAHAAGSSSGSGSGAGDGRDSASFDALLSADSVAGLGSRSSSAGSGSGSGSGGSGGGGGSGGAEELEPFDGLPPPVLGLTRSASAHNMAARVKRDAPVPLLAAQILPVNAYVQQRSGSILSRATILKADQFPNENLREGLDLHVIGAPNFQQVRPLAIYSTGQPNVSGIRTVLNLLHLKQNPRRRVQWINLREEPVIYLNNRPFVLRELEQPFRNMLDFQGIDKARLSQVESRLKHDILSEADDHYGNILVHDEVELGEIRACWNSCHESNVKTSDEVFQQLTKEKYNVSYLRVPVTAESVFEAKQIDALVRCYVESQHMRAVDSEQAVAQMHPHFSAGTGAEGTGAAAAGGVVAAPLAPASRVFQPLSTSSVPASPALSSAQHPGGSLSGAVAVAGAGAGASDAPLETFFVLNDQMGRGRSTIGMIVLFLLMQHTAQRQAEAAAVAAAAAAAAAAAGGMNAAAHAALREAAAGALVPASTKAGSGAHELHDGLAAYRRGEFDIMLRLVRLLRDGRAAKHEVDAAIDACGRVHHLREQIVESFVRSEHARADDSHAVFSAATASYLKRYFYLVCFASYLKSAPDPLAPAPVHAAPPSLSPSGSSAAPSNAPVLPTRTFSAWWSAHPELQKLVNTLVEDEGLMELVNAAPTPTPTTPPDAAGGTPPSATTALAASAPVSRSPSDEQLSTALAVSPTAAVAPSAAAAASDSCSLLDRFVFSRCLPVLSKRTIIKSEFFHFATRHQRALFEHGLPNFRYYENLPLAATAQPNVRGIRNILNLLESISRRRDRRFEMEEAQQLQLAAAVEVEESLRQVLQKHSNVTAATAAFSSSSAAAAADAAAPGAGSGLPSHGHGHGHGHSASALLLSANSVPLSSTPMQRAPSDTSDDGSVVVESRRYKGLAASGNSDAGDAGDTVPPLPDEAPAVGANEDDSFSVRHNSGAHGRGSGIGLQRSASLPGSSLQPFSRARVLWICLREEPVLFINSEPYLIRDYLHPFRLLTEFNTGMTAERTEQVEEGFKADVLHELQDDESASSSALGGATVEAGVKRLVVHEETVTGQIHPRFEPVREPLMHHVQTTREVYAALRAQGYNVTYARVPLHVEEVPGLRSFDRLFELLNSHRLVDERVNIVLNCQKGGRRSTMGMVVCVLMLMHQRSVHYSIRSDTDEEAALAASSASGGGGSSGGGVASAAGNVPGGTAPASAVSLSAAERLAALNLSISRHGRTSRSAAQLESLAGGGQDEANVHGHTVSISAHATPLKRVPTPAAAAAAAEGSSAAATPERQAGGLSPSHQSHPSPALSPSHSASSSSSAQPALKKSASSVSIHIEEIDRRDTRARYGRGEYKGILALTRVLKEGGRVKEEVDVAIDAVGSIVNIRDSIALAKGRADAERQKDKGLLNKALKYLESYAYLICFNSYLRERRDTEEEEARAAQLAAECRDQQQQQQVERNCKEQDEEDDEEPRKRVQFPDDSNSGVPSPRDGATTPAAGAGAGGDAVAAPSFTFPAFSLWIQSRPELRKQLESIHHNAEDALRLNLLSITDDQYASVYESRAGHVLVNGSLLKHDWFMGSVNKNIEQIIEGAINFRPIDRFPCAGTGIPTAKGIRGILEFYTTPLQTLRAQGLEKFAPPHQAECILWFNLREEPLLYVNERPFVLRDSDNPYVNIEHTGINTRRLEAMERQLRRDILEESERMRTLHALGHHSSSSPEPGVLGGSGGGGGGGVGERARERVLLHDEDSNGNLIAVWEEPVNKRTIQTPQRQFTRCFEEVQAARSSTQGCAFEARYYRTPITDEQAPSPSTLNDIVRSLETARHSANLVLLFNCQMGRGRTTTGLIIACLWCIVRGKVKDYEDWLNLDRENAASKRSRNVLATTASTTTVTAGGKSLLSPASGVGGSGAGAGAEATTSTSTTYMEPSSITGDDELSVKMREEEFANGRRHGWYRCIQSLIRVLPDGPQIKRQVDRVIDHCGVFQNLREVVYETQVLALTCLPRKKAFFVHRGVNYLKRYFFLILIHAYFVCEVAHDFTRHTFAEWVDSRPEINNILATLTFPEELPLAQPAGTRAGTRRGGASSSTTGSSSAFLSPPTQQSVSPSGGDKK